MPLYEYKCEGCGEKFDVRQKFSDEPVKIHDKCGAKVERLISAPSFHFKGTGWYVTDYAKGGSNGISKSESDKTEAKSEAKAESKSENKSSSDAPAKTESKPAVTTETSSKPAKSD